MQGLGKYEGDWCNVRKNLVFRKGCRSNLLQLLWSFESGDEFHPVLPQHLLPSKNDADNLPYRISTPHSFMRSQGYLVVSWRRLLSSITHSHADDRFFSAYLITMIMFIFKVVIITFHRAFSLRSLRATGKKKPRGWEGFFRRVSSHHWKPDDGVRLTMRWVSLGLLGSGVCRPLLLGPPETSDGLC